MIGETERHLPRQLVRVAGIAESRYLGNGGKLFSQTLWPSSAVEKKSSSTLLLKKITVSGQKAFLCFLSAFCGLDDVNYLSRQVLLCLPCHIYHMPFQVFLIMLLKYTLKIIIHVLKLVQKNFERFTSKLNVHATF